MKTLLHPFPALLAGMLTLLLGAGLSQAQTRPPQIDGPILYEPIAPSVFAGDLRQLPATRLWREGEPFREVEDLKEQQSGGQAPGAAAPAQLGGPAAAPGAGPGVAATLAPVSFDGIPATGWVPPDTVGDIGPDHYVQAVNISLAIYDRSGNLLVGPSPINALWAGFGGPCATNNNGDPIVRYDHLADRWLVSQFALGVNFQCIAISRTPDPVAGGWYLYAFPTPGFPDYPKIGVWPDGYYMGTQRGFVGGGLDVYAFDRIRMLNGLPAGAVQFFVPAPSLFLQPSDLDGPAPATGTPNFFVRHVDRDQFGGPSDRLEVFAFSVNWGSPAASTFLPLPSLPVTPFDATLCGDNFVGACAPQPGTSTRLETLPAWLMWRLQYRNFGTHETLVTNHTINTGANHAGIRWYELRRTGGGPWSVFQQGTHSPDTALHRWMGSAAMNADGCLALGYSASSNTVFPGIRYAGRVAADPAGTLPVAETTLLNGGGSQTGSFRWGNYSTMDVDPLDDRTFWYTTEYYSATSSAGWRTRVASFQLPGCGSPLPVTPVAQHQVTLLVGGLLTDDSLPLNAGFDTGFLYRRHRFAPLWSWELETSIAFTEDAVQSGLLANGQLHLVRHLNAPPSKVLPFLLAGIGVAHYDTLGFSDTAPLATLGIGADFAWTPKVGFRLDLRALWLNDLIVPGWTTNVQVLWGPTFAF